MNNKITSKRYTLTKENMLIGLKKSKPLKWFKSGRVIKVNNRMQSNYNYMLEYNAGTNLTNGGDDIFYPDFKPMYSPKEILLMGAFEGKYCNDQIFEFPCDWFNLDKLSPSHADPTLNYFGVKSRQSLQEWRRKKWIPCCDADMDTRGWFEWYCRYWLGRRMPDVDKIQIRRWRSFNRHYAQYKKHTKGHIGKHPKRRQALLQWSYPCDE